MGLLGIGLAGLAALGMVGWLYLRRQAPDQRLVSTLLFWEPLADLGTALNWRGRWREHLSLGLHLLGAALLIALLGWAWQVWGEARAPHLVVLERDPILGAPAAGGDETLTQAQLSALAEVLAGRRGPVALVVAEPAWRVLAGWTPDHHAVAALAAAQALPLEPGWPVGDSVPARLLERLRGEHEGMSWTWIGVGPPPELGDFPARWQRLEPEGGDNSGWTQLLARRDPQDPSRVRLRAVLQQAGQAARGTMELRRDGQLRDRRSWALEAGGRLDFEWNEPATLEGHRFSVVLQRETADRWLTDDGAVVEIPAVAPLRVGVAGAVPGSLALALAARARVTVTAAEPDGQGHDLVVAAGAAAGHAWPHAGAVWRLAPPAGAWGERRGDRREVLALPPTTGWVGWDEVDPSGLVWARVAAYLRSLDWPVLLEGLDGEGDVIPLLWRNPSGQARPEVVWAVPADAGEWLERPVFPIAVGSLLEELRAAPEGNRAALPGAQASLRAGTVPDPEAAAGDRQKWATGDWRWLAALCLIWAAFEAIFFTRRWTT